MKNKILTLLILLCSMSFALKAQDDDRADRFRAQRVSFLTERMKLNSAEAQRFWPVYNEYSEKRDKINQEKIKLNRYVAQFANTVSDKEANDLSIKFLTLEKQEVQLREDYHKKFTSIVSARKVLLLYQGETQFKAYLLKQIRGNSDNKK